MQASVHPFRLRDRPDLRCEGAHLLLRTLEAAAVVRKHPALQPRAWVGREDGIYYMDAATGKDDSPRFTYGGQDLCIVQVVKDCDAEREIVGATRKFQPGGIHYLKSPAVHLVSLLNIAGVDVEAMVVCLREKFPMRSQPAPDVQHPAFRDGDVAANQIVIYPAGERDQPLRQGEYMRIIKNVSCTHDSGKAINSMT